MHLVVTTSRRLGSGCFATTRFEFAWANRGCQIRQQRNTQATVEAFSEWIEGKVLATTMRVKRQSI